MGNFKPENFSHFQQKSPDFWNFHLGKKFNFTNFDPLVYPGCGPAQCDQFPVLSPGISKFTRLPNRLDIFGFSA